MVKGMDFTGKRSKIKKKKKKQHYIITVVAFNLLHPLTFLYKTETMS